MPFVHQSGRIARRVAFAAEALAACAAATLFFIHPVAAASALATIQSAVTCAVTGASACVSGSNESSGVGVSGSSSKGYGVYGSSTSDYGVRGISSSNYGVSGKTGSGLAGVYGTSASKIGVYGQTTGGAGGIGVSGSSPSGIGVKGAALGEGGVGVSGVAGQGDGVSGSASDGGRAIAAIANGTATGVDVETDTGAGVDVVTEGGTGVRSNVITSSGGAVAYPLVIEHNAHANLTVDQSGNIVTNGTLVTQANTARGAVTAYTAKSATPTVEDTGTARLVAGSANVRFEPAFAASIDPAAPYRVFVSPDGDIPHGLYVGTKTVAGFVVREAQGGRSTVDFDYRIVATARGETSRRMAFTTPLWTRVAGPEPVGAGFEAAR